MAPETGGQPAARAARAAALPQEGTARAEQPPGTRVLLVQAHGGRKEPKGTCYPLGLAYVATAIADRHDVSVFDLNLCEGDPHQELAAQLRARRPAVVGLSIRNIDTLDKSDIFYYFKTVPLTVAAIKATAPGATIVAGGAGFSIFAAEIMERVPQIDFGVCLEGEETFAELLEKLDRPEEVPGLYYRRGGTVQFSGMRPLVNFRALPAPRKDFVDPKRYARPLFTVGIQSKRGCASRCVYCSYPFLNGNSIRLRSPRSVVDEIEEQVRVHGVREFMFVDGVFNVPEEHAKDICREILSRRLDVEWAAWCEIRHFSEEFLLLAKSAGCRVMKFSPDAASDRALYSLGKDISAKDIDRAVRLIRAHREIQTGFGFFCTPPGQTVAGFFRTIFMYVKLNILLFPRGGAALSWIRIEPHTRIQELAIAEGLIRPDTNLLPEREEGLERLYYTSRPVWLGDRLVEGILWFLQSVARPAVRSAKSLIRVFKPGRRAPRGAPPPRNP